MVLVSSGGVSKPTSAVYLFLNFAANGIMDAKIAGEDQMRALYAAPGVAAKGLGYSIVRPGGLTNEPPVGVEAVELNQGDDKSGRIARADVASLCVQSIGSADAFCTTFECYYRSTAKPIDGVGMSNLKSKLLGEASTDATGYTSGWERQADAWPALFEGLQRDTMSPQAAPGGASSAAGIGQQRQTPWWGTPVQLPEGKETKPEALRRIFVSSFGAQVAALSVLFVVLIAWSSSALNDDFWTTPF